MVHKSTNAIRSGDQKNKYLNIYHQNINDKKNKKVSPKAGSNPGSSVYQRSTFTPSYRAVLDLCSRLAFNRLNKKNIRTSLHSPYFGKKNICIYIFFSAMLKPKILNEPLIFNQNG